MQTIEINGLVKVPDNKYADYNIVRPYKQRTINLEKPIKVYRNLHQNCYSIMQGSLVVAHAERLCVRDVTFKVNEKSRQKIISTKQKNVHAFIQGFYDTCGMGTTAERNDLPVKVYYNPYKTKHFMNRQHILKGARFVIADKNGVRASYTH
tara:strand:+ start:4398 stop:4850 length:453 start_codon:yes stop_codon:yes gene_type:complete